MLRYLFAFIILIHGLIHFMGFAKAFSYGNLRQLTKNISKPAGILWLVAAILFIIASIFFLLKKESWPVIAFIAIIISQVLIITIWKDAKWGTFANIIIFVVALVASGNYFFNQSVNKEISQIFNFETTDNGEIITKEMTESLPFPVKHWLQNSGVIGHEKIHYVRLKQKGFMRTKPGQQKWMSADAEQYFTIDRPAFIWKVRMKMAPLTTVAGRDKFVNGKGGMTIKLLSLVTMVNESGSKIDQAALQRWLAEICWFPSAGLSPYIKWEEIDSLSAKATLSYKNVAGAVIFYFNEESEIIKCTADRFKENTADAPLKKWMITVKRIGVFNGIKIPAELEVAWQLKEGNFTWYKITLTEVEYNKAEVFEL